MNTTVFHLKLVIGVLLFGLCLTSVQAQSNIDPSQRFAWSETGGWLNFLPTGGGVEVTTTHLSGFAWGENIGWIKFGADGGGPYANTTATNWGVNRDPGTGELSGFAWSETMGWLNFGANGGQASINPETGEFTGYVWSENMGWVNLSNLDAGYGVSTLRIFAIPVLSFGGLLLLAILLVSLAMRQRRRYAMA